MTDGAAKRSEKKNIVQYGFGDRSCIELENGQVFNISNLKVTVPSGGLSHDAVDTIGSQIDQDYIRIDLTMLTADKVCTYPYNPVDPAFNKKVREITDSLKYSKYITMILPET